MQSKKKYNMRKIQKKEIKSKIKPFKPDKKEDAHDRATGMDQSVSVLY